MIKTQFGSSSTAAEVAEGIDLTGKRVTGAASGIGVEESGVDLSTIKTLAKG